MILLDSDEQRPGSVSSKMPGSVSGLNRIVTILTFTNFLISVADPGRVKKQDPDPRSRIAEG